MASCQLQRDNKIFNFIKHKNFIENAPAPEINVAVPENNAFAPEIKVSAMENNAATTEKNTIVSKNNVKKTRINLLQYVVGEPYSIDGVEHVPKENYSYNKVGLATYYDKELHNFKTINNDLNKVTELLGRHKTLPIPSIVKITNLENGLSLIIKINDRHQDNSSIIQVSRKTAQLLRFYRSKIARVKVEILIDPSKQLKIVTQSMNYTNYNDTIKSAPTEEVFISNLEDNLISEKLSINNFNSPIEMGFEEVKSLDLYLKIYDFTSYNEAKNLISALNINHEFLIQSEGKNYSLLLGPLENKDVYNLVTTFISRGYKKNNIILE